MELVSLAGELLQSAAEHVASYPVGQTALRYLDSALKVVEKCARWAVPPPLDQDERPQPELVRPLPWVFFLGLLIILRVTRESISLANLIMGKPPLRSADVVIFIQGRRRYLHTLKYQGNRMMRARTSSSAPAQEPWYQRLQSLFDFIMCFRNSPHYGNNNTTSVSNNDEVLVVKRSKRGRSEPGAGASPSSSVESTMERLIEKMMLDLDAPSDDDSSFTLTNVTSEKSDRSECTGESDQDATLHSEQHNTDPPETPKTTDNNPEDTKFSPIKNGSSTPEKTEAPEPKENNDLNDNLPQTQETSAKQESLNFIQNEISHNVQRTPKNEKIANGRTVKSVPSKNKGNQNQRRDKNVPVARIASGNDSF